MRYEIRPLGQWTGPRTPHEFRRGGAQFRAAWNSTLELLGRETDQLGAHFVVLQVDVRAGEIRRDGMLRADARVDFPGVRVSFDSHHGPLTYATDTYTSWRANVRAIALALQALRAVDRYGVSKRGEQYRGWAAIEAGPGEQMSADQAARLLAAAGGGTPGEILHDPIARRRAHRAAVRKHHPDALAAAAADEQAAAAELFRRVQAAKELLDQIDQVGGGFGG